MAFVFGLQTLKLKDFSIIYQSKGLTPKIKGRTNFYECYDLTEKVCLVLHRTIKWEWNERRRKLAQCETVTLLKKSASCTCGLLCRASSSKSQEKSRSMLNLEPPALTGAVCVCSTSNEASGGGSIVLLYSQARVQLAIASKGKCKLCIRKLRGTDALCIEIKNNVQFYWLSKSYVKYVTPP